MKSGWLYLIVNRGRCELLYTHFLRRINLTQVPKFCCSNKPVRMDEAYSCYSKLLQSHRIAKKSKLVMLYWQQ